MVKILFLDHHNSVYCVINHLGNNNYKLSPSSVSGSGSSTLSSTSTILTDEIKLLENSNYDDDDGGNNNSQNKIHPDTNIECHLRPVIHILQHHGCIPKPIPSFACYGTCTSYVQVCSNISRTSLNGISIFLFCHSLSLFFNKVSSSKFWQVERSCNCCQEIGEREASITLYCPKEEPQFRKVCT